MKLSQGIKILKELKNKHGDLELRHFSGECSWAENKANINEYYEKPGKQGKVLYIFVSGSKC